MALRAAAFACLALGLAAATSGVPPTCQDSSDATCASVPPTPRDHLLIQTRVVAAAKAKEHGKPPAAGESEPADAEAEADSTTEHSEDAHPPVDVNAIKAAAEAAAKDAHATADVDAIKAEAAAKVTFLEQDPSTDHVIGPWRSVDTHAEGLWCQVGVPPDDWALKSCPTTAHSSDRLTVKVLTYNLYWWNLFDRRGGDGQSAGKLIGASSAPEQYDFMAFQECDDKDRIVRDARENGLAGEYTAIGGDKAVAIAFASSRWELLEWATKEVGEDSHQQYYGKRLAMWARFSNRDNGKTVFFVNHHGPLPVSGNGGCTGSATSLNILDMIANNAHVKDAIILVGDFNARPDSTRVRTMDRYLTRVYSGRAMGGVDHFYTNCGDGAAGTNLGHGGSDHDALSVTLHL